MFYWYGHVMFIYFYTYISGGQKNIFRQHVCMANTCFSNILNMSIMLY